MGEYYQVPHIFYRLHPKFRTPYISLAVFSILASIIVVLSRGDMLFLADLYNFGAQIAFFFAHLSLIVLRIKNPTLQRPFKAPFNISIGKKRTIPLTAVIGTMATFSVWMVVIITKPDGRNLGFIWLALGVAMFLYYRKKKQISPTGQLSIEKIKIPEYHPMHLNHILVTARILGNTEALQTACQLAKSFGAKLTAVHVIEIPVALPMHAPMLKREQGAEAALKRAEAVAREYNLSIDLKLVRARSVEGAILDLIAHADYDMVVVGARKDELKEKERFALEIENLLRTSPIRVLFCKS
jgi:APA family basic amino acid/polyamine antiporter